MTSCQDKIIICAGTRKILNRLLFWPAENNELNPGIRHKIRVVVLWTIMTFLYSLLLIHVLLMVIEHPEETITEDLAQAMTIFSCFCMNFNFLKKQKQLALLLRDLSHFGTFGRPQGFKKKCQSMDKLSKLIFVVNVIGMSAYTSLKMLQKSECQRINEEKGLRSSYCGLLGPVWIPFEIDYFPIFYLAAFALLLLAYIVVQIPLMASSFAIEIVQHIKLRIRHLEKKILESFEEDDYEMCHRKLRNCILYHIEILGFVARLDAIFFNVMFGLLTLTSASCALIEKQIVEGINTSMGIYHLIGWIVFVFVACVAGQELLDATDVIPGALWKSKWYQSDLRLRKNLYIMLMRSQQNLYMNAGPFGILCFPLFISLLKMSYSIFCMLSS